MAETATPGNSATNERRRVFLHGNVVAEVFQGCDDEDNPMNDAAEKAKLIAEAFNVLHETGMTPRQLADALENSNKNFFSMQKTTATSAGD